MFTRMRQTSFCCLNGERSAGVYHRRIIDTLFPDLLLITGVLRCTSIVHPLTLSLSPAELTWAGPVDERSLGAVLHAALGVA